MDKYALILSWLSSARSRTAFVSSTGEIVLLLISGANSSTDIDIKSFDNINPSIKFYFAKMASTTYTPLHHCRRYTKIVKFHHSAGVSPPKATLHHFTTLV